MDRATGKPLGGDAHIRQSVADILSTLVGTRCCARLYGSHNPQLIDQPMNEGGAIRLFASTALALLRWEPRIRLKQVAIVRGDAPGAFLVVLQAERRDVAGAALRITVPLGRPAAPAF